MSFEEIYFQYLNNDGAEDTPSLLEIFGIKKNGDALEVTTEFGEGVVVWAGKDGKVQVVDKYLCSTRVPVEKILSNADLYTLGREDGKLYQLRD